MSTLKLILVRHGQDEDSALGILNGRRDPALTAQGRVQALEAAARLRSENVSVIYSSPLRRASQTASIIAEKIGAPGVRIEDGLVEREYGVLTGRPVSDIPRVASSIHELNGFRFVLDARGAESYVDLWERAGKTMRRISKGHDAATVLIVAHNEINKMIRANFNDENWDAEIQRPPLAYGEFITLTRP